MLQPRLFQNTPFLIGCNGGYVEGMHISERRVHIAKFKEKKRSKYSSGSTGTYTCICAMLFPVD